MFRPAGILPDKGVVPGVRSYRIMYATLGWALRIVHQFSPGMVTTSVIVGRALLRVDRDDHELTVLEGKEIHKAGAT